MDNAIYTALYSKLSGGTALCALIGGTATPRIYHSIAPDTDTATTFPCVIFDWVAGGYSATSQHVDGEGIFRIRAIATTSSKDAGAVAVEVFNLLDRSSLGSITGYSGISLFAEPPHMDVLEPTEKGTYYFTAGDDYRLRVEKS
jgi:hypothetical protein